MREPLPQILSIIHAVPGWRAVYNDNGTLMMEPVNFWAVVSDGLTPPYTCVVPLVTSSDGETSDPTEASNFVGVLRPEEPEPPEWMLLTLKP